MAVSKKTGKMKGEVKFSQHKLENLEVKWSNLNKPDELSGKHAITVMMTKDLKEFQNECIAQSGIEKLNGVKFDKDKDGNYVKDEKGKKVETAKFTTGVYVKEGLDRFPKVFTKKGQMSKDGVYSGDIVNLLVKPKAWEINGEQAISFYLNEVQVVSKGETGFLTFEAPAAEKEDSFEVKDDEEDLPF